METALQIAAVRALQQAGLLAYREESLRAVGQYALELAETSAMTLESIDALVAHDCVGAAELAVVEQAAGGHTIELPVTVHKAHMVLASIKWNCSGLYCPAPTAPDQYHADRITLLSGDAEKIATLAGTGLELISPRALHDLVRRIEDGYRTQPTSRLRAFGAGRGLRLQGVLWRLQLTIDKRPGFLEPLDTACLDTVQELGLHAEPRAWSSTGAAARARRNEELLHSIEEMSLIDLADFVRAFEARFDVVSAGAPTVVSASGESAPAIEQQDEFDVVLQDAGNQKLRVIREVRALTNLGLSEAKDLVDSTPRPLLSKVSRETAERAKSQLERAGASVEVR